MGHTTNIGNFSVASVEFGVDSGTNISATQSTAVLTLIPDAGYTITASDFSYTSGPSQVSGVTFAQSGQNVIATVTFDTSAVMPSSDLDIPICISGESGEVSYTLSGNINVIASSNVTPSSGNIAYTASGNTGDTVQVFSQTISADTGYFFPDPPTGSLTSGNSSSYTFTTTEGLNNDGEVISKTFIANYTFGSQSVSGDVFTIVADADLIPVIVSEITSYTFSTVNIDGDGETRSMVVFGTPGAEFSLNVVNEDGTPVSLGVINNQVIPGSGSFSFNITFPAVTDNDDYDFTLTGDLASTFDTSSGQPSTFTVNQYVDINLIFGLTTQNSNITPGATVSFLYPPDSQIEPGDSNHNFSGTLVATSTTPIIVNTAPTTNDFTNLNSANNGGTTTTINSVSAALSNGDLTYTVTFEGTTTETGIADVLSTLNLDYLVSTNFIPVAQESQYSTYEDTQATFDLNATDGDNDTLTYTIVTLPTNGTFTEADGATPVVAGNAITGGQIIYNPNLNYNGSDSFEVKANDGTADSNTALCTITVIPVNDAPIISATPWTQGTYSTFPNPVNSHEFTEGDAFSATATATDIEDAATSLTWSIISEYDATGSGDTTTPLWITGTTNANGSFTITADSTGIRAGTVVFYLKVADTGNPTEFDTQKVQLGGITPTVNSYFKFWFDNSGSMGDTQTRLNRDLLNSGVTDAAAYADSTYLRYYLQDFYATGLTYDEETAQNVTHNNATNGVDDYNAKVDIDTFSHVSGWTSAGNERIYDAIINGSDRITTTAAETSGGTGTPTFPDADSVFIGVWSDESNSNYYTTGQYPTITAQARMDVTNLRAYVESLNTNKGTGFYKGAYFSVVDPDYGAHQDDMWNDSIAGTGPFSATNQVGTYVALDGTVGTSSGLSTQADVTANFNGQYGSGTGQLSLIDDGNTTNGYYTEIVVNYLRNELNYNIPAYGSTR